MLPADNVLPTFAILPCMDLTQECDSSTMSQTFFVDLFQLYKKDM
jgi:hypothetical protein